MVCSPRNYSAAPPSPRRDQQAHRFSPQVGWLKDVIASEWIVRPPPEGFPGCLANQTVLQRSASRLCSVIARYKSLRREYFYGLRVSSPGLIWCHWADDGLSQEFSCPPRKIVQARTRV